jgi:hypothetical protein
VSWRACSPSQGGFVRLRHRYCMYVVYNGWHICQANQFPERSRVDDASSQSSGAMAALFLCMSCRAYRGTQIGCLPDVLNHHLSAPRLLCTPCGRGIPVQEETSPRVRSRRASRVVDIPDPLALPMAVCQTVWSLQVYMSGSVCMAAAALLQLCTGGMTANSGSSLSGTAVHCCCRWQ